MGVEGGRVVVGREKVWRVDGWMGSRPKCTDDRISIQQHQLKTHPPLIPYPLYNLVSTKQLVEQ
jgi:hypothetical protein